jgi:acetylornithine/succinyldiaminopimelate/putrescine aminotransferase
VNPQSLTYEDLMGPSAPDTARALEAAHAFLAGHDTAALLPLVGQEGVDSLPAAAFPDKRWFQKSYGRCVTDAPEDLLAGQGLFYLTEQRKLFLDGTAGHYQMTWGYQHPALTALLLDGIHRGIAWDNHSNIPAAPVKRLAEKLVAILNPGADLAAIQADGERLNTVLLGTATGTVACAAAMKIMLVMHRRRCSGTPAFIMLDGNYHGTDLLAQRLRGMWPEFFTNLEVVSVQPNDPAELEAAFARLGERVAGFWAEPIMMNREAIAVDHEYLGLARRLCDESGALMAFDEIQTGFWYPEVLYTLRTRVEPDFVVMGKGLTAGLHPLSALVYRGKLDVLAQYDAISTNGNAALAAYLGLGCIELIERESERIGRMGERWHQGLVELVAEFPGVLQGASGEGHLSGLKFRDVKDALGLHKAALDRGLWLRAHAYHEGHSTVLSKFALPMDEEVAAFALGVLRDLIARRPWA